MESANRRIARRAHNSANRRIIGSPLKVGLAPLLTRTFRFFYWKVRFFSIDSNLYSPALYSW